MKGNMKRLWKSFVLSSFGVSPLLVGGLLFCWGFEAETEKMLTLFLSIVWGVMVALGGSIIYMRTFDFSQQDPFLQRQKSSNKTAIDLSVILIMQTLLFLILSVLFPVKSFVISSLGVQKVSLYSQIYDCLLFSLIIVPSLSSILIGIWCLYLTLNKKHTP